jgi:large exoprotein involved in heme utilization and adhesion
MNGQKFAKNICPVKRMPIYMGICCFLSLHASWAQQVPSANQLPSGGKVVAGPIGISQNAANMVINQATSKGVIDWASFDVGSKAQVSFLLPSSKSITLNRVLSANPTQIYGRISSNGQIFLTNGLVQLFIQWRYTSMLYLWLESIPC